MTGMRTACLACGDVLEILLRPEVKLLRLGEVGERLGEAFRAVLHVVVQFGAVLAQLLLEQRIEHDGRRAGVFHLFDAVNFLRERRGRGNQRRAKFQSEIGSLEIHNAIRDA